MAGINRDLIRRLRDIIREYEDRKVSSLDLSKEAFHAARALVDPGEAPLRRSLERFGNRVSALSEGSLTQRNHRQVLKVVDDLEAELVHWGY